MSDLTVPDIKARYSKAEVGADIINKFYVPLLSNCSRYDRITGYFSSSILSAASIGFSEFCKKENPKMRMIVGVKLYEKDVNVIENPNEEELIGLLSKILEKKIEETLDAPDFEKERLAGLAWMLQKNFLEIKIGIVLDSNGKILPSNIAYYHPKEGMAYDDSGNSLHFIGGINESEQAWDRNADIITVHKSWIPHEFENHIEPAKKDFNEQWEINGFDKSRRLAVVKLPDAVKNKWIKYHEPKNPSKINETRKISVDRKSSPELAKWSFQEDAVQTFLDSKAGILEMATGTGKTRTSLKIVDKLVQEEKINSVIVCTPANVDLATQWYEELIDYNFSNKPIISRHFSKMKEMDIFLQRVKTAKKPYFPVVILFNNKLTDLIDRDRQGNLSKSLLIADEVHNIGSPSNVKNLSGKLESLEYKLGLSATPEREYDEVGQEFIDKEIGPTIFEFNLKSAIERGVLCEFEYRPIKYNLTKEENEKIQRYMWEREARIKEGEDPRLVDKDIRIKIARVVKLSQEKLKPFEEFLKKNHEILDRCIIFVFTKEYGKLVQNILFNVNRNYHTYYAEDQKHQLENFSKGNLDLLLTCHKISEGIDIRSVKNIILFYSDRAKLETIQRIGRCLRKDPSDPKKKSFVLDFVRETDFENNETTDGNRYQWLTDVSASRFQK